MENKKLIIIVIGILAIGCIIGSILYIGPTYEDRDTSEFLMFYFDTLTVEELFEAEEIDGDTISWLSSLENQYSLVIGDNNTEDLKRLNSGYDSSSTPLRMYLVKTDVLNKVNLHSEDLLLIKGKVIETREISPDLTVSLIDNAEIV